MMLQAPPEHSFERTLVAATAPGGLDQTLPAAAARVCAAITGPGELRHDLPLQQFRCRLLAVPAAALGLLARDAGHYAADRERLPLAAGVRAMRPFPYPDLSLALGMDPHEGTGLVAADPAPRAFVVYAAEVADYGTVLNRLAHGSRHPPVRLAGNSLWPNRCLRRICCRLRPRPSAASSPTGCWWTWKPRRTPCWSLAEAWYPGWRAED